jgi:hypothetical protein
MAVAAVGVGAAQADTTPQTVMVGNQVVTVPSNGHIMVNGMSVPVLPGAKRVVTISPPAGSTPIQEDGQTSYQLPAGATGEAFSVSAMLAASSSAGTSIPSTAVYSTAQANRRAHAIPHDTIAWGCDIWASAPTKLGGVHTVKGYAGIDNCTTTVQAKVTATLYWENTAGSGWVWENNSSDSGVAPVSVGDSHWCTAGTSHYWHIRNDTIAYADGTEAAGHVDSNPAFLYCS